MNTNSYPLCCKCCGIRQAIIDGDHLLWFVHLIHSMWGIYIIPRYRYIYVIDLLYGYVLRLAPDMSQLLPKQPKQKAVACSLEVEEELEGPPATKDVWLDLMSLFHGNRSDFEMNCYWKYWMVFFWLDSIMNPYMPPTVAGLSYFSRIQRALCGTAYKVWSMLSGEEDRERPTDLK